MKDQTKPTFVDGQWGVLDVLGIGFGPSNISIAIALQEMFSECRFLFLEKKAEFGWHKGMLFDDAIMQVNFLKDLVSFRNPRSKFTFVNFLHEVNRLVDFSNLKTLFPSRIEFHQYLNWCADHFSDNVVYSHVVREISAENYRGERVFRLSVGGPDGPVIMRARALVHGAGLEPHIPFETVPSKRIVHGYNILDEIDEHTPDAIYAVVGAGQSAAEIVQFLYRRGADTRITAILSRFGYMPSDDSPFVNQLFDPDHVDTFYNASAASRWSLVGMHSLTNYSAVDVDLISELYSSWYQGRVIGQNRLQFDRMSRVVSATPREKGVSITLDHALERSSSTLEVDYLICATGFRSRSVIGLMSDELKLLVRRDVNGAPHFERDYSMPLTGEPDLVIFAPDMCEPTHGLTSTLISNMATRSGEIVESLRRRLSNTCWFNTDLDRSIA
jgi:L-ornithine N5-oxygenase